LYITHVASRENIITNQVHVVHHAITHLDPTGKLKTLE